VVVPLIPGCLLAVLDCLLLAPLQAGEALLAPVVPYINNGRNSMEGRMKGAKKLRAPLIPVAAKAAPTGYDFSHMQNPGFRKDPHIFLS